MAGLPRADRIAALGTLTTARPIDDARSRQRPLPRLDSRDERERCADEREQHTQSQHQKADDEGPHADTGSERTSEQQDRAEEGEKRDRFLIN